ncbi:MAG: hypothetical protein ACLFVH_04935 [Phycisphaerae bacterium]
MSHPNTNHKRGTVYILVILVLCVLGSLAVYLVNAGDMNMQKAENFRRLAEARNAAESGLGYLGHVLRELDLPNDTTAENLIVNMSSALGDEMDGKYGWGTDQTVSYNANTITIPAITLDGATFSASVTLLATEPVARVQLKVTGSSGIVSRSLSREYAAAGTSKTIFDYAVASKGKVAFGSNSKLIDKDDANSADILAMQVVKDTIKVTGSAEVQGELMVTGGKKEDLVTLGKGNNSIVHGISDPDEIMSDYVHEVPPPPFPTIDITEFTDQVPSWTTIDSSTGKVNKNSKRAPIGEINEDDQWELNNIVIEAGTNYTFGKDTVINGVVYIKSPNNITFGSKVTINGVIVTDHGDTDGDETTLNSSITFTGQASTGGIDSLDSDDPQFAGLVDKTGTSILAPGFGLTFKGTSDSYSGTIAADHIEFRGNTSGGPGLDGSVIGLNENFSVEVSGTAQLDVSRSKGSTVPPGFKLNNEVTLEPVAGTYSEE